MMLSEFLSSLGGQSALAYNGLLILGIGAIGAYFKQIPDTILDWLSKQTTLRLVITDETQGFNWYKWWLDKQNLCIRHADLNTPLLNGSRTMQFGLAPGTKWFMWKGRPCRVSFFRKEAETTGYGPKRVESIQIQTYGRDPGFFVSLVQEMKDVYDQYSSENPTLYRWSDKNWRSIPSYTPRPLESVILANGQKEKVLYDIVKFHAAKDWYMKMGVPYHRGYLLYGPPGTGKSALVTGLSAYFKSRLYLLKLNELNDETLSDAIANIPAYAMILLEDVDCVVPERKNIAINPKEDKIATRFGVSLAGLLNVLDGLHAPLGAIFFMTTNYPERLDPAIVRPGRVDVRVELGAATREQKKALYSRFFPTKSVDEGMLTNHGATTMAEFQELLIQERNAALGGM